MNNNHLKNEVLYITNPAYEQIYQRIKNKEQNEDNIPKNQNTLTGIREE